MGPPFPTAGTSGLPHANAHAEAFTMSRPSHRLRGCTTETHGHCIKGGRVKQEP